MEKIIKLTPVDEWPIRDDPQTRFDQKVVVAMNQVSTLVNELNTNFIPRVNDVSKIIPSIFTSLGAVYVETRPTEIPEDIVDGGLIIYKEPDSLDDYEIIQVRKTNLISLGFISHNIIHKNIDENISGKYIFTISPEVPTTETSDNSDKIATTKFVQEIVSAINIRLCNIDNKLSNTVSATENQGISGIKTFSESPLIPTPHSSDSSTKGANTEFVNNAITNIQNTFTTTPESPLFGDESTKIATTFFVRDTMRAEIEAISNGQNTVIRDKFGYPHIMVVIPRFNVEDVDTSLGTGVHPAFIVNGEIKTEIFIGKYLASKGNDIRVKTSPRKVPWVNINFDDALSNCYALGNGFSLCTRATYSARILWLWKQLNDKVQYGNTNWGRNHSNKWQTGTMLTNNFTPGNTSNNVSGATLTGSGVIDWNDDGTPYGVSDLVGNVWEWESGFRLNDGEIQIIPDNNAMLSTTDLSSTSTAWKAINTSGALVSPGISNTLKYTSPASGNSNMGAPSISTSIIKVSGEGFNQCDFVTLTTESSITVPSVAKQYLLYPHSTNNIKGSFWVKNYNEMISTRGGSWIESGDCGLWCVSCNSRSATKWNCGFRISYYI